MNGEIETFNCRNLGNKGCAPALTSRAEQVVADGDATLKTTSLLLSVAISLES
jgi:hypothetical protein